MYCSLAKDVDFFCPLHSSLRPRLFALIFSDFPLNGSPQNEWHASFINRFCSVSSFMLTVGCFMGERSYCCQQFSSTGAWNRVKTSLLFARGSGNFLVLRCFIVANFSSFCFYLAFLFGKNHRRFISLIDKAALIASGVLILEKTTLYREIFVFYQCYHYLQLSLE